MLESDWQREMATWLAGFPWQWFCTLTFRPYLTIGQRRRRLRDFMKDLKRALGTSDFNFIAIPELGKTGDDYHYHVLVGGLRAWNGTERLKWMKRWSEIGGDARIDPYRANAGGLEYVLKNASPDNFDDIELDLGSDTWMQSKLGQ